MSNNAGERISTAVQGIVAKIEQAADTAVEKLDASATEMLNKIGRVEDKIGGVLKAGHDALDELLFGDNGGPSLDGAEFPKDIREAAGQPIVEARPNAATASKPQPSKLGGPTGGITASDVAKKPE